MYDILWKCFETTTMALIQIWKFSLTITSQYDAIITLSNSSCNKIYVYLHKNNVCGCCSRFDHSNIAKPNMTNYRCFSGKKYFVYKKFDHLDNFRDDLEFLLCAFEKKYIFISNVNMLNQGWNAFYNKVWVQREITLKIVINWWRNLYLYYLEIRCIRNV